MIQTSEVKSERSAEFLRMAIPLMSRHAGGFEPPSYAVWYEYVSGANEPLRRDIDRLIQGFNRLSLEVTEELYRRHVVDRAEEAVIQAKVALTNVIDRTHSSVDAASNDTTQFDSRLADLGRKVQDTPDPADVGAIVVDMGAEVRRMRSSLEALNNQLESSRRDIDLLTSELRRARDDSYLDPLTGVANRRALDEALLEQCRLAHEQAHDLCVIMVDIDHFKQVNDRAGHLAGDRVIRAIAQRLQASVKRQDVVARFGGEEFTLVLPATPLPGALTLAERLRADIERTTVVEGAGSGPARRVTVSLGVAQLRQGEAPESLLGRADKALYVSKQSGRNRVTAER